MVKLARTSPLLTLLAKLFPSIAGLVRRPAPEPQARVSTLGAAGADTVVGEGEDGAVEPGSPAATAVAAKGKPVASQVVHREVRRVAPRFAPIPVDRRDGLISSAPGTSTGLQGAPIPLSPAHHEVVALMRTGELIVLAGQETTTIVNQVMDKARELKLPLTDFFTVAGDEFRAIVDNGKRSFLSDDFERMQKDVLQIFEIAYKTKVNDVLIRTTGGRGSVWFCINDAFYKYQDWDADYTKTWLTAAYNMCQIQDGTYRDGEPQAARMSSTPELPLPGMIESIRFQYAPGANNGRAMVARLLMKRNFGGTRRTLASLGYEAEHIEIMQKIRSTPFGVIFMTGPTGSGKSTTLVVSLEDVYEMRGRRINIISIEDPPEYEIACAIQMPVANVTGERERTDAFERSFNAVLRMKPHVIMVGEVRDYAAASLLLKASMSGHQCWSSIHSSSGLGVPARLAEMGVAPYLIRDPTIMIGLVFQRLLPTLCDCALPFSRDVIGRMTTPMRDFMRVVAPIDKLGQIRFRNPEGCPKCKKGSDQSTPGETGQTVCAEVIAPTSELLDACLSGDRALAEKIWLSQPGSLSAFEHGIRKMLKGLIDPFEVFAKLYSAGNVDRLARDPDRLHAVETGDWSHCRVDVAPVASGTAREATLARPPVRREPEVHRTRAPAGASAFRPVQPVATDDDAESDIDVEVMDAIVGDLERQRELAGSPAE